MITNNDVVSLFVKAYDETVIAGESTLHAISLKQNNEVNDKKRDNSSWIEDNNEDKKS